MKNKNTIIEIAKQTNVIESLALGNLVIFLTKDFEEFVNFFHNSNSRLIVVRIIRSIKIAYNNLRRMLKNNSDISNLITMGSNNMKQLFIGKSTTYMSVVYSNNLLKEGLF